MNVSKIRDSYSSRHIGPQSVSDYGPSLFPWSLPFHEDILISNSIQDSHVIVSLTALHY